MEPTENKGMFLPQRQLLSASSPFAYSEAFKALRTNLSFASISKQYKKIILTSAVSNEGKSTVAANLAITLAESGAKVLLMDCDLRNPTLHRLLRDKNSETGGLTALLAKKTPLEETIVTHPRLKFDFIKAGAIPPNPVELLESAQMEALLDELEQRYDYVICDTPPVSIVTDAAALSRFCDGVILVVRQNYATREKVKAAKQNLDAVQANIMGTILSCYDLTKDPKDTHGKYGSYYYYGPYQKNAKKADDAK